METATLLSRVELRIVILNERMDYPQRLSVFSAFLDVVWSVYMRRNEDGMTAITRPLPTGEGPRDAAER